MSDLRRGWSGWATGRRSRPTPLSVSSALAVAANATAGSRPGRSRCSVAIAGTVAAYTAFRTNDESPVIAAGPSGASTGPADVAEFTCDGTGTGTIAPSSLAVDARSDGVHVAVTNLADERIAFTVGGSESTMYVVGHREADPGERKEILLGIPPGDAHVSCVVASKSGIDTAPMADLRVVDPSGSYIPIDMDCPMSSQATQDATGFGGDPVDVARQHLSGLEYDDAVERAGYPLGDRPIVRVRRNGDVVAMATFRDDGQGGWLVDSLVTCANVPIGWTNDIAGVSGPMGPTHPETSDSLCALVQGGGSNDGSIALHIEGLAGGFDRRCLIAPAGEPFTIRLRNGDLDVLRNVSIYEMTPYLRERVATGTPPSRDVEHPLF